MEILQMIESKAREACGFSMFQRPVTVQEIQYTDYTTVDPEMPIRAVASLMAQKKISFVLVGQDQEIVGLITETDLLKRTDSLQNALFSQKAKDILSSPLHTVGSDLSVWEASRIMEEKRITKLPVTVDGKISGVITRSGVLRVLCSYGIWKEVREIMTRKVVSLEGSALVEQAAKMMYDAELSCVVVMEDGRPAGIFTERDYIKRILALQRNPWEVCLREVMSSPLLNVTPDCTLFTANRIMSQNKVRRLVIQEQDRISGIITQTDMFLTVNEKIREEEKEYIRQLEESPQGILVMDATWKITHINAALLQMLGISDHSELLGKVFLPDRFWFHPEDKINLLEELQDHTIGSKEITLCSQNGKILYITLFTTFFRSFSDQQAGCQCLLKDITAQKELVALREAQEQLREAKERAEEANVSKSTFLASMSHEIRTPMNAILGFGELLSEETLTEEQHRYAKIIRNSAQGLLSLINDILDISKIEAGKMPLDFEDTPLAHLLEYLDSILRPMAIQKGLEFEVVRCNDLPAVIRTDTARLRQCLMNLLNNAIKFTKQGHVYLNVSCLLMDGQPFVQFAVEDTGIGIPAEHIEAIFDPYTRADHPEVRRQVGTGLGLSITRKLAVLLGGDLIVSSQPGKGSVFTLSIPGPPSVFNPENETQADNEKQSDQEETTLSGKILVVEDNPSNQMLFSLILKKLGLEVVIAAEGQEGLEKVRQEPFDLILMDMQMPTMNGYEASRQIRQEGYEVPIIAVTADAMKGDQEKCLQAGCTEYLSKPIDKTKLIEILQKYLSGIAQGQPKR
ncbi:MAG: CBS domain-containing protein [Sedimentisphaerales bacterium]|nr:CBS domain-containing protein [Sedimentisphaerales bacterium]